MIKDHTDIILNSKVLLNNTIAAHKLVAEKFQMKITEIGGREIESEEDMNCLEPTKIEYFKEKIATWFMLKKGALFRIWRLWWVMTKIAQYSL